MSDVKLGQLIEGEAERDCVHVALAPVVASCDLSPGTHVGLTLDGLAIGTVGGFTKPIGIVDPFLPGTVPAGSKFWLVLYPNTVTGMRHQWAHPCFGPSEANLKPQPAFTPEKQAELWITRYAQSVGMDYAGLLHAGHAYIDDHDYINVGAMEGLHVDPEFWKHFEILTGKKGEGSFFSCSC